jgi:hypothetical protein
VLRYRRSLEDREQLRLHVLLLRQAELRQQLEQMRDRRANLQVNIQDALVQAKVPAAELQFGAARDQGIRRAEEQMQVHLRDVQTEIVRQISLYRAERQRREALESLRDEHLRIYEMARLRREQAMLDELNLIRRSRRPA